MTSSHLNDQQRPRPVTSNHERLLKAEEAAKRLGISPRKLWELKQRRAIRHVAIGRRVLYRPEDLDDFIEQSSI